MAKHYKIKRSRRMGSTFHRGPNLLKILLWIVLLAVLIFVGVSIYEPVYNFIMGDHSFFNTTREETSLPDPEPSSETDLSSSQTSEEEPEPEPEPEPMPPGAAGLKIAYLPINTLSSADGLTSFLESLEGTDINAVMVDLKDQTGTVLYNCKNQSAIDYGAVSQYAIDLDELVATLESHDMQLVVRIFAFNDQRAANGNRDNAIHYQNGDWLWLDNAANAGGKPWLNPFAEGARKYIADLSVEATKAGAVLVVLDDVQFPDASGSTNATFGTEDTSETRAQILAQFVEEVTTAVGDEGGNVAVYVAAGYMTDPESTLNLVRYGGSPIAMAGDTLVAGLLPYQFTAGYSQGGLELDQPLAEPGDTVKTALQYVQRIAKQQSSNPDLLIIPLIQGGNEPAFAGAGGYTPEQILAQITAAEGAGAESYLVYSTSGTYLLK